MLKSHRVFIATARTSLFSQGQNSSPKSLVASWRIDSSVVNGGTDSDLGIFIFPILHGQLELEFSNQMISVTSVNLLLKMSLSFAVNDA